MDRLWWLAQIPCWCKSAKLWLLQDGQVHLLTIFGHVCCREGLWGDVVVAGPAAPLPSSPQLSSTWRCYSGLVKMGFICFRSSKTPDAYLTLWKQQKKIQKFLSPVHSLEQSWSLYSDTAALCKSWLYHWTLPKDISLLLAVYLVCLKLCVCPEDKYFILYLTLMVFPRPWSYLISNPCLQMLSFHTITFQLEINPVLQFFQ